MSHDLRVRCVSAGSFTDAEHGSFEISEGSIAVADEAVARDLLARHKRLEHSEDTDEAPDSESDGGDGEASETCGAIKSDGEPCERSAESCPYHDAEDR